MLTTPTNPPKNVNGEDLDRLYRGPLEEFTAVRNELARSLRSEGARDAADWMKGLRKPSRAAWLVNQLTTRKPKEIRRLLEIDDELRVAQEEMLAGATDRTNLRQAARREQETIDALLQTAEAIGREHGVGQQILTRVGETLQAASSDPEVAEAIRQGRLDREQRAAGIGLLGPATPSAPAGGSAKRAKEREAVESRDRRQRAKRRQAAERKLAAAEKRLERERAKLERAREAVEAGNRSVHEAELGVNAARRAVDEID